MSEFWENVYFPSLRESDTPDAPETRLILLVADEIIDGLTIHETNVLPDGECTELETIEINYLLNSYVGPGPRTSMNDDCEVRIVIPEVE